MERRGHPPSGATAVVCADDKGNGNSGTAVQVHSCLSDLSDYWSHTAAGQLVHNGDCLSQAAGRVSLQACLAGGQGQQRTVGAAKSQIVNKSPGTASGCRTVPSGANGTRLTVAKRAGAGNQLWTAPAVTPGSGS
ncbi:MAG TPA: ricin-type beta-trefoil lectin domain protein [Trebonia sp.]|nr:ricin-type beta-trefoil lectin domain protein [Trebonia sp.]